MLDRAEIAAARDHARSAVLALREAVPAGVNQRIGRAQRSRDARIAKTAADMIVPFERLAELLDLYDAEVSLRRGLAGAVWGHISDGNLHPNVIPRSFDEYVAGTQAVLTIGRAGDRLGRSPWPSTASAGTR